MSRTRDALLLALLALALFLPGLGSHDLWAPDEPRYAEVAREMAASGEWLVPHLNGEVYKEKPPLLFWLIAAAGKLTGGLDETAARLPSALAGAAAVPLVYLLATLFVSRQASLLSALVYASCIKIQWQARIGQIDMLLGALVLGAVLCWAIDFRQRRGAWIWGFWLLSGVATVAKGPVGLLPGLLSILAFLAWEKDRDGWRRLRLGRGFLLWALVVLAWFVPAVLVGGEEYLQALLLKQNVTRFANPWGHHQPWHYYLTSAIPADFLPWVLVLPGCLLALRRAGSGGGQRQGVRLAVCWAVVTVVFFSLSPGKRNVYLVPMYPALAMLVGVGLAVWPHTAGVSRRWLSWPTAFLGSVLALAAAALGLHAMGAAPARVAQRLDRVPELALLGSGFVATAALLFALFALSLLLASWLFHRRRVDDAATALATSTAAVVIGAALFLLAPVDRFKSARPMGAAMATVPAGEPIGLYPKPDAGLLFYSQRFVDHLDDEAELRAFLAAPGPRWLVIPREDLAALGGLPELVEVAADGDPHRGYLLLAAAPPGP